MDDVEKLLRDYRAAVRYARSAEDRGTHGDGKLKAAQKAEAEAKRALLKGIADSRSYPTA